jgi:uncharacterized protein (DUF1697 family)
MPAVVFLKGVNVGGYRSFRPSALAKELSRFDVVNVGAAGTFVVRKRVSDAQLRAELRRRLPFEAHMMICRGSDVIRLAEADPFAGQPSSPTIVRFVSVLAKRRAPPSRLPLKIPASGEWGLQVLAVRDRFVLGLYRRQMRAIGYLGRLEKIFGTPVTTRSWSTILAIARVLESTE